MRIVIAILFIMIGVNCSYASILYSTPALFQQSSKPVAVWTEIVSGAGEHEFKGALNEFQQENYTVALNRFEKLITDHPDSEAASIASLYAGSIFYWLALKNDKKDDQLLLRGLKSFQNGIRTIPSREKGKIPAILLATGKMYLELNMIAEARGSFRRVMQDYPATEYAVKGQYMLAVTNLRHGNYKEALLDLNLRMFMNYREMEKERVFLTAEILFSLNEFGDSRKYYEEGVKKWPAYLKGNPKILYEYSECQFQNGDIAKAREGFLTYYNLYPGDKLAGMALKRAGETFALAKNISAAEMIFNDVITFFPQSDYAFESMLELGDLKLMSNVRDYYPDELASRMRADIFNEGALKYYKDVESASGNELLSAKARFKTARVLEEQGRYQEAFNIYIELMDQSDKSFESDVLYAMDKVIGKVGIEVRKRLELGDKSSVLKLYHAYYKNNLEYIKNEALLMDLAAMHEGLHLYSDAHLIYDSIIERDGISKEQSFFNAGKLYARSGDDRKAVDTLRRYISEYPDSARVSEARTLAGYCLYDLKEYEKASHYFYSVTRDAPHHYPEVYLKLAAILHNMTQYQDSINVLKDMLAGTGRNVDVQVISSGYIQLGNAYYGLQRYQEAVEAYREGMKRADLKEGADSVEFMIGDSLLRLGKAGEAKKVFSRLTAGSDKLIRQVSEERLRDIELSGEGLSL